MKIKLSRFMGFGFRVFWQQHYLHKRLSNVYILSFIFTLKDVFNLYLCSFFLILLSGIYLHLNVPTNNNNQQQRKNSIFFLFHVLFASRFSRSLPLKMENFFYCLFSLSRAQKKKYIVENDKKV